MGFKVSEEQLQEWKNRGLIAEADLPSVTKALEAKKPKKAKRELVEAAFIHPGTWIIPLCLEPVVNGPAMKRQMIGRAGKDRKAVSRALAERLFELSKFARCAQEGREVHCNIIRLSPGQMDDDNVRAAAKYVRDTVAMFLGVDDGPKSPVQWHCRNEKAADRKYGVRIELLVA